MTPASIRYRIQSGELNAKKVKAPRGRGYEWRVYLDEEDQVASTEDVVDDLTQIGDELIAMGKRLKRAIKEHDEYVRRETIAEVGQSLAESVKG
jgi:uncharacterized protein with von Willebrand factor type A (vWA) domain